VNADEPYKSLRDPELFCAAGPCHVLFGVNPIVDRATVGSASSNQWGCPESGPNNRCPYRDQTTREAMTKHAYRNLKIVPTPDVVVLTL